MSEITQSLEIYTIAPPKILYREFPLHISTKEKIHLIREDAIRIMENRDNRLLIIVGPCSIHDPIAALEYGDLLKKASHLYADDLLLIMRTYFEKPRTTIGWKGFIRDPLLDKSHDIHLGLRLARKLLIDLNNSNIYTATEFLDNIIPAYISDLISWSAIGARTSASQLHRELASDLPLAVGFKNDLSGNINVAINGIKTASHSHSLLHITQNGEIAIKNTTGNPHCHLILRGSDEGPNFDVDHVKKSAALLHENQIFTALMIDCSHGNSMKNHLLQKKVVDNVAQQMQQNMLIKGVMLESHLIAGKQSLKFPYTPVYGQSITDSCISWQETLPLLEKLARANQARKKHCLAKN